MCRFVQPTIPPIEDKAKVNLFEPKKYDYDCDDHDHHDHHHDDQGEGGSAKVTDGPEHEAALEI